VSARGWRSVFSRSISAPAVALSIACHAVVAYAVNQVSWSARQAVRAAPTSVIWLNEWRPFERNTESRVREEPIETGEVPVPPAEAEPPAQAEQPEPPVSVERDEGAATASSADDNRPRTYLAPGIDWEAERQRAVARVLEDLERQARFSTDDSSEEAPPNPREHLFDNPSRGSRGGHGAALQPGRARSRFLNRVAELCNALTGGGIGIGFAGFGLGSACTDAGPTADFFADLRPDALNSLPECAEPEDLPALAIERRDEIPTIKCRLVLKDEDER
jgi:hypothetical protein